MKTLHLISGLRTGGAEMTLYKLLSSTDRGIFEPTVISLKDAGPLKGRIEALGIKVYQLNLGKITSLPTEVWRLLRIIRTIQPDLIQGWMYHGNLAASFAKAFTRVSVPVLWNIRHTPYDLKNTKRMTAAMIRLGARFSHHPARIIYNSKVSAARHKELGYSTSASQVIPNGYDLTRFAPSQEARASVRAELGLRKDTLIIGLLARYHPMKDHQNFLKAAAILAQQRPDAHFLLAGTGVDQSNDLLTHVVHDNNLQTRVHLLGERQDTPRLTAALDIATSTSAWGEAFSNVLGEAMACGVPCVATEIGDAAWIVGQNGHIIPAQDSQALAAAWQTILDLGVADRKCLGQQARQHIEQNFSLRKMTQTYEQLYQEIG